MKKFFKGIVTAAAVLFASTSAFAAYTVDVTTEQPGLFKIGCERAGAITFTFKPGAVLTAGDRWQVKLPPNVTLCKDINYVLGDGDGNVVMNANTLGNVVGTKGVLVSATDTGIDSSVIDSTNNGGPVYVAGATDATRTNGLVTAASTKVWFYVSGTSGGSSVTIWVLGTLATDKLTIGNGNDDKLVIKLFDGRSYVDAANNAISSVNLPDLTADPTGYTYAARMTTDAPNLVTSLCIALGADFTDNCVNVSYPSNAVLDNTSIYQFSNDFNIGCIDPRTYQLFSCAKTTPGTIPLPSASQGVTPSCTFKYEGKTTAVSKYCTGYVGNRIIIQSNKTYFAETGDIFTIDVESKTTGVYFGDYATILSFNGLTNGDPCTNVTGDAGVANLKVAPFTAAHYTLTAVGNAASPALTSTSNCAVPASNRIYKITAKQGASWSVDAKAKYVQVELPTMIYDKTDFNMENVEAKVAVTLNKVPCGTLKTFDVTLGTFVKVCGASTSSTLSLIYPFFPSINATDSDANWWAGIIVTNGSTADGTATLVFSDKDGAQAKMTTPVIKAGGQYILGITPSVLAGLTPVTGTFDGNKKYSVQAYATFANATGFAIVGAPPAVSGGGPYKPYTSREF